MDNRELQAFIGALNEREMREKFRLQVVQSDGMETDPLSGFKDYWCWTFDRPFIIVSAYLGSYLGGNLVSIANFRHQHDLPYSNPHFLEGWKMTTPQWMFQNSNYTIWHIMTSPQVDISGLAVRPGRIGVHNSHTGGWNPWLVVIEKMTD